MNIKQLTYLLEIEKTGSLNKASQTLYVTQPNISKVIKSLEKELNITLFVRKSKSQNIVFTPEGKEFLYYAKCLKDQFEIIENKFIRARDEDFNKFCVSSQHFTFAVTSFIEFLKNTKTSSFEYILREEKLEEIIENIVLNKSHIGIISISCKIYPFTKKFFDNKNIEFISLKKVLPHIFVRKDHPLAKKEFVYYKDLADYTAVFFEQEVNALNFHKGILDYTEYKKIIKVTDRDSIYQIIKTTDAYNIGTGFVNNKEVVSLPILDGDKIDIGYIKLKNCIIDENINIFLNLVRNNL